MKSIEKITKIISEYKDLEGIEITPDTTMEELQLDSLDTVDMLMECEEAFGVEIEASEDLKTIGDLLVVVEQQ